MATEDACPEEVASVAHTSRARFIKEHASSLAPPPEPLAVVPADPNPDHDDTPNDKLKAQAAIRAAYDSGELVFCDYIHESDDILYSATDPPIIAPEVALAQFSKPWRRAPQYTASMQVDRINETMLMKSCFHEREAKTMMFVQEHTNIPVPKVHLVFSYEIETYMVMEFISGGDLQHLWPSMDAPEKESVLTQVKKYLHELRNIVPASKTPGPIDKGRCDGVWFSPYGSGPFVSHQHFVNWLNSFLDVMNQPQFTGERFTADTPLVFTHRDFVPRNLVLSSGILWVVDWGLSGWYPPYMEYCAIAGDWGDRDYSTPVSWKEAVLPLVGDYWRKYEMMHSIRSFIESSYTRSTIAPPDDESATTAENEPAQRGA